MVEQGSPRASLIRFVAFVLAAGWLACAAVLTLLLGGVGLSAAFIAAVLAPSILGMTWFLVWFRFYYHLLSPERRDPDGARKAILEGSLLTGAICLGLGSILLFDRRFQVDGVLAFVVAGILGLSLGTAVAKWFPKPVVQAGEEKAEPSPHARLMAVKAQLRPGRFGGPPDIFASALRAAEPAPAGTPWLPNRFPLSAVVATETIVVVPLVAFGTLFALLLQNTLLNVLFGIFAVLVVAASLVLTHVTTVRAVGIAEDAIFLRHARGRFTRVPWDSVVYLSGPERADLTLIPCCILRYAVDMEHNAGATLSRGVGERLAAELETRRPGGYWARETGSPHGV